MRCFTSSLALVTLISTSMGASADDLHECQDSNPLVRIAACTRVLSTNPSEFSALANRGVAYRITGDYVRALADLETALRRAPHYGLYHERGMVLARMGQNVAALRDFNEALRSNANLVQAYFERAMVYEEIGQYERAKADIESAVNRDVRFVAGLYADRGQRLVKEGYYQKAIAALDKSIEIKPDWPSTYFNRGAAQEALGNRELAVADYHKALQFQPIHELQRRFQQSARERLAILSAG